MTIESGISGPPGIACRVTGHIPQFTSRDTRILVSCKKFSTASAVRESFVRRGARVLVQFGHNYFDLDLPSFR
jgi:hypothetical protein